MFVEFAGISSQAYGCGVCGDAKNKTCKECAVVDGANPCNTAVLAPAEAKTFECYGYKYDADSKSFKVAKTANTCHAMKSTLVRCNSPGKKADAAYVQSSQGCGFCPVGTLDAETCKECELTGCNRGEKKCNKGTDKNSLTEEVCSKEVSTCTSPIFVEFAGISSQAYGCGVCGEAKNKTCKECAVVDGANPCNTAVLAPAEAKTFECYGYKYDADSKSFKVAKTATTCHALKSTLVRCNIPGEKADATYEQSNGGCGFCPVGTLDAETCKECDKTGCNNSSNNNTSILVPLIVAIFNLFKESLQ